MTHDHDEQQHETITHGDTVSISYHHVKDGKEVVAKRTWLVET
jgi:hypothetical protein